MTAELGKSMELAAPNQPQITGPRGRSLADAESIVGVIDRRQEVISLDRLMSRAGIYDSPAGRRLQEVARLQDQKASDQAIAEMLLGDEPVRGVYMVAEWERDQKFDPLSGAGIFMNPRGETCVADESDYRIHAVFQTNDRAVDVVSSSRYAVSAYVPDELDPVERVCTIDQRITEHAEWHGETAASYHTRFVPAVVAAARRVDRDPEDVDAREAYKVLLWDYVREAGTLEELQDFFTFEFDEAGKAHTMTVIGLRNTDPAPAVLIDPSLPAPYETTGESWTLPLRTPEWNIIWNTPEIDVIEKQRERME